MMNIVSELFFFNTLLDMQYDEDGYLIEEDYDEEENDFLEEDDLEDLEEDENEENNW